MEDEKISSVAKFCEHALCAIDNYPGHKIYRYDLQKSKYFFILIRIMLVHLIYLKNWKIVKADFKLDNWSYFYVRK